jgi:acetyl esterase/lipase
MHRWRMASVIVVIFCGLAMMAGRLLVADPFEGVSYDEDVVFDRPGGVEVKLDIARPKNGNGPFPLFVFIHGGGWEWGDKAEFRDALPRIARIGYVCASVDYRRAPACQFPAQLDDVRSAITFLCKNAAKYHLDPDRVALFGGSAGGHLALLAGFTAANDVPGQRIRAIASFAGPTDLPHLYVKVKGRDLVSDLLGTTDRQARIASDASPITHVRRDVPPVITIHGEKDELVPISQAMSLHHALEAAGATQELLVVPGGGHDATRWTEAERNRTHKAVFDFLIKHLGGD